MARRLPPSSSSSFPSSSSSLTILSHLLARGLDELVASVGPALGATPKFFERGWGSLGIVDFSKDELVASLSRFEPSKRRCFGAWLEDVEKGPVLDLKWTTLETGYREGVPYVLKEASFETPALRSSVAKALPAASRVARARLLTPVFGFPNSSSSLSSSSFPSFSSSSSPALYVHLAGTGDHGFDRRLRLGAPLLVPPGRAGKRKKEGKKQQLQRSSSSPLSTSSALSGGIATLALESPFYGSRRPPWQSGAKLARVSDLIALGRATIEEALALLRWGAAHGFGRAGEDFSSSSSDSSFASSGSGGGGLGVTGLSMGGVHAAMVASLAPGPLAAVPMLAPRSAAAAFCRGALWRATAWEPFVNKKKKADKKARSDDNEHDDDDEDDDDEAVFEALLAAASAAPPGSAAAKVAEALAAKGWPLSSSLNSPSSALAAAAAASAAREALEHVLETYTDITRFPPPPRRDAAILLGAESDAYVSKSAVEELARHWGAAEKSGSGSVGRGGNSEELLLPSSSSSSSSSGAEVRWVPGGHVSAFLSQGGAFRGALVDAMERLALPAPAEDEKEILK